MDIRVGPHPSISRRYVPATPPVPPLHKLLTFGVSGSVVEAPVANAYYIATDGSDSNTGTILSPWATFLHAATFLTAGDVLYARGGTYTRQGGWWNSGDGVLGVPVTFSAYPGETVVFDGENAVSSFLLLSNTKGLVVRGFEITNYLGAGGIWMGNTAEDITIENNYFHDIGVDAGDHHIYISWNDVRRITVRNNVLDTAPGAGFHIFHSPNVVGLDIYNNIIINNKWGILACDNATDINIYNNVFYNNWINLDLGPHGEAGVFNVKVKNNIGLSINADHTNFHVGAVNVAEVESDNNIWYHTLDKPIRWNATTSWPPGGGSQYTVAEFKAATTNADNSIEADPLFVDAANGNFQLQSGSPAIGQGATLPIVTTDINGISRPQSSTYDIGAYEVEATGPYPNGLNVRQAESGSVSAPMGVFTDAAAGDGFYVASTLHESGSVFYNFNMPTAGDYRLLARIYAVDTNRDSFYVTVDSGTRHIWHLNPEQTEVNWGSYRIDQVNSEGTGDWQNPEFDPVVFTLSEGDHTLLIECREMHSRLDYFYFNEVT